MALALKGYNEDEPRDPHGEWTTDGSGLGDPLDAQIDGMSRSGWPSKVLPPGYWYHGTKAENFPSIQTNGLQTRKWRFEGSGLDEAWREGVFFSHPQDVHPETLYGGLLLRVPMTAFPDQPAWPSPSFEGSGDRVFDRSVPPEHLEYWGGDKQWHPLVSSKFAALPTADLLALREFLAKFNPNHDESGRFATGGGDAGGAKPIVPTKFGDGQPYGAPYSADQRMVLTRYTEEESDANMYLRGQLREPYSVGETDRSRAQAAKDAAIIATAARPLPTNMTLLRGTDMTSLGLPDEDYGNFSKMDAHANSLIGETVRDGGFMGTTTDPNVGYYSGADVQMHIRVPAGTPVVEIGDVIGRYHESERLLPPGTGIKVTNVQWVNDGEGDHWRLDGKVVR